MDARGGERQQIEQLKRLGAILCDPTSPVYDPQGYAQAYVNAALVIEADPAILRRRSTRDELGAELLRRLRELPGVETQSVPESQRAAVRLMRELTEQVSTANVPDPGAVARMVAVHRRHRGGAHYDQNLGAMRAGIAEAFMEAPSRRRRRKANPTPQLQRLGVGDAATRVMQATDRLIELDKSSRAKLATRAREIQVIAELIARHPELIERPYLRRKLGQKRLARLELLLG